MQACATAGRLLPTEEYQRALIERVAAAAAAAAATAAAAEEVQLTVHSLRRYRAWLGRWDAQLDACTNAYELMVHADFSTDLAIGRGNEPVWRALQEIATYELAVWDERTDAKDSRHLAFARAAAAVKACAFVLPPDCAHLEASVPFVGPKIADEIKSILEYGTCDRLENFRANRPAKTGRPDSAGAAARATFTQLPGVGLAMASRLWDAGVQTLGDLELAVNDPLWLTGAGASAGLRSEHIQAVRNWRDLTEAVSADDRQEMQQAILEGVETVTNLQSWHLTAVGGFRRGEEEGDGAHFILHRQGSEGQNITHDEVLAGKVSVIRSLHDWLLDKGKIMPFDDSRAGTPGFFGKVSDGQFSTWRSYLHSAKKGFTEERSDNMLCIFKTSSGKLRRLNVIHTPHWCYHTYVLVYTGSSTWYRTLKMHVKHRGMRFTQYGIMRWMPSAPAKRQRTESGGSPPPRVIRGGEPLGWPGDPAYWVGDDPFGEGGVWLKVPEEIAPASSRGSGDWWPEGWQQARRIESEADIFALLGLPYRSPPQRCAF